MWINGYRELSPYVKMTGRGRGAVGQRLKVHRGATNNSPGPKVPGKGRVGNE